MRERILRGWNLRRGVYLMLGVFAIVESIIQQQWVGVIFGAYFASMGLFAFGCAGGNCAVPPGNAKKMINDEVEYEEIKTKEL